MSTSSSSNSVQEMPKKKRKISEEDMAVLRKQMIKAREDAEKRAKMHGGSRGRMMSVTESLEQKYGNRGGKRPVSYEIDDEDDDEDEDDEDFDGSEDSDSDDDDDSDDSDGSGESGESDDDESSEDEEESSSDAAKRRAAPLARKVHKEELDEEEARAEAVLEKERKFKTVTYDKKPRRGEQHDLRMPEETVEEDVPIHAEDMGPDLRQDVAACWRMANMKMAYARWKDILNGTLEGCISENALERLKAAQERVKKFGHAYAMLKQNLEERLRHETEPSMVKFSAFVAKTLAFQCVSFTALTEIADIDPRYDGRARCEVSGLPIPPGAGVLVQFHNVDKEAPQAPLYPQWMTAVLSKQTFSAVMAVHFVMLFPQIVTVMAAETLIHAVSVAGTQADFRADLYMRTHCLFDERGAVDFLYHTLLAQIVRLKGIMYRDLVLPSIFHKAYETRFVVAARGGSAAASNDE